MTLKTAFLDMELFLDTEHFLQAAECLLVTAQHLVHDIAGATDSLEEKEVVRSCAVHGAELTFFFCQVLADRQIFKGDTCL